MQAFRRLEKTMLSINLTASSSPSVSQKLTLLKRACLEGTPFPEHCGSLQDVKADETCRPFGHIPKGRYYNFVLSLSVGVPGGLTHLER